MGPSVGVHLYFQTAHAVPDETQAALRRELGGSRANQPWVLCEPPHFYDTEGDGVLRGGTKLNLHPWPDEYREAMEHPPERTDLQAVLDLLTDWSARFDLTWELTIDGNPLGSIEAGDCPPNLSDALEAMAALADELADFDPMTGEHWPDEPDAPSPDDEDRPPPTGPRLYRG